MIHKSNLSYDSFEFIKGIHRPYYTSEFKSWIQNIELSLILSK